MTSVGWAKGGVTMAAELSSMPLNLPLHLRQMGGAEACGHRSGWTHVLEHLKRARTPTGILFDDFIERTFQHNDTDQTWERPWVGIFHHPPDLPAWLDPGAPIDVICRSQRFLRSLPHLKGAIALSEHLGSQLRTQFAVPVLVAKHPTEVSEITFSLDAWKAARTKRVVQIGWYARNQRAIYQLDAPKWAKKIHIYDRKPWIESAMTATLSMAPTRGRPVHGEVEVWDRVDNLTYDRLLSDSLIFGEYFGVSASNTVIEAIARCTPILVNRHPALEEYLGRHYPLFYTDITQASRHLSDQARIEEAHAHLKELDRSWLDAGLFVKSVEHFLRCLSI